MAAPLPKLKGFITEYNELQDAVVFTHEETGVRRAYASQEIEMFDRWNMWEEIHESMNQLVDGARASQIIANYNKEERYDTPKGK